MKMDKKSEICAALITAKMAPPNIVHTRTGGTDDAPIWTCKVTIHTYHAVNTPELPGFMVTHTGAGIGPTKKIAESAAFAEVWKKLIKLNNPQ